MKLTATTTSTSLWDLIKTADQDAINAVKKHNLNYGVEIAYTWNDVYVETILDEATSDSRPVNSTLPVFAFNCLDIQKVYIYGSGDFSCSIV